jgi:hypothetical protein
MTLNEFIDTIYPHFQHYVEYCYDQNDNEITDIEKYRDKELLDYKIFPSCYGGLRFRFYFE